MPWHTICCCCSDCSRTTLAPTALPGQGSTHPLSSAPQPHPFQHWAWSVLSENGASAGFLLPFVALSSKHTSNGTHILNPAWPFIKPLPGSEPTFTSSQREGEKRATSILIPGAVYPASVLVRAPACFVFSNGGSEIQM